MKKSDKTLAQSLLRASNWMARSLLTRPIVSLSLVVLLLIAAALKFRKKWPLFLVGLIWFLTSLLPVLNFFPTHPVVADRYAFFAVFGFGLMVASVICSFSERKKIISACAIAVVVVWFTLSLLRTMDWRTDITLWEAVIKVDPMRSREFLAHALWKEGRFEEAISELKEEKDLMSSNRKQRIFLVRRLVFFVEEMKT